MARRTACPAIDFGQIIRLMTAFVSKMTRRSSLISF